MNPTKIHTATLLIADRNPHVRKFLAREMAAEGYRVRLARNGREVLRWVYHYEPLDLVILDLDLPDASDAPLLERLGDRIPSLPIVVHTFSTDFSGANGIPFPVPKQGVEAIWQPEPFTTALRTFEDEARAAGARVVVWAMWARDPARDAYGIYREPWGGRDVADQTRLQAASTRRAARTAVVAPVGEAWLAAHTQLPEVELHSDGSHATLAGAYLTALVLHGIVHGRIPVGHEGRNEDHIRWVHTR